MTTDFDTLTLAKRIITQLENMKVGDVLTIKKEPLYSSSTKSFSPDSIFSYSLQSETKGYYK